MRHHRVVGGRTGTLGEFAIAYDEGRLIGVLTETGGITEIVETIIRVSAKETGACVLYEEDPEKLIDRLIEYYRRSIFGSPHVSVTQYLLDDGRWL